MNDTLAISRESLTWTAIAEALAFHEKSDTITLSLYNAVPLATGEVFARME